MKSHNTKSVLDELRAKGFRMTPQRMMVLEAVEASEDHISAEEIFKQAHAKYPYLNISTVYRTLEMMKEQDLVAESDLGGGRLVYHPVGKAHHHHLVCRKCGSVQDVDESVFTRLHADLKKQYGFDAELEHMAIFGTCKKCGG